MQSRMSKYYDNNENSELRSKNLEDTLVLSGSRASKNQTLYKEVSNKELEEFDLNSNVSVIGEGTNVDIDKIREMLDRKYRELPKKRSIGSMEPEIGKINLDETREYDLNSITEKAREKKEVNYEEERLKKLRNTQYDILKNLDLVLKRDEDEEDFELEDKINNKKAKEEKKLQDLIDTITAKELLNEEEVKELDPLDILSDLRGNDENTRVMGALSDQTLIDENIIKKQITKGIELEDKTEKMPLEIKPIDIDMDIDENNSKNLSKTNTISFTQSDFDDFNDLKEDMQFTKILIKILIFIIIIVFVVGCVILANNLLGLGLF